MITRVYSGSVYGTEANLVEVEVRTARGKQSFEVIGLGDSAVRESRDRVQSALKALGLKLPQRVLINLAPADIRKEGSIFDLPMAVGILAAMGILDPAQVATTPLHGELSLDGRLKPLRGAILFVANAQRMGFEQVALPAFNLKEAGLIPKVEALGFNNLEEVIRYFREGLIPEPRQESESGCSSPLKIGPGLEEVAGQARAKRALHIAASGGHNVLMLGPPGCGKSMMAERFVSILPPMQDSEIQDSVFLHSLCGNNISALLRGERTVRSPHHVISEAGLIGGGSVPKPGEISLAHNGVLFLDEFPEFRRAAIESLRAPLETGRVTVSRVKTSVTFPARFQLLAAMNPCPCGRLGLNEESCRCTRSAIANYLKKVSEPILDRIDLQVELEAVPVEDIFKEVTPGPQSKVAFSREDAQEARSRAIKRFGCLNKDLSMAKLRAGVGLSDSAEKTLINSAKRLKLSGRGYVRVIKVARTIADIEADDTINQSHIAEALSYRGLDRIREYSLS